MKNEITFQNFLSGITETDYVFQKEPYNRQIQRAARMIKNADYVLIGAGAGLSTAAGLTYSGKRFDDNFSEFKEKYGMTDMYSAGFYPFPSEEAMWGYWARNVYVNLILPKATQLYKQVLSLIEDKDYFVLTTNVDRQFHKAGFNTDRIFATQGDYGRMQCARGCHNKTYDNTEIVMRINGALEDCLAPSELVPKCPVCGGKMVVNLRSDNFFTEDAEWHAAEKRFGEFMSECINKKTVLLELGVGFNTPTIIRFPFDKAARENSNIDLIRLNLKEAIIPRSIEHSAVGINEDLSKSIRDILNLTKEIDNGTIMAEGN